MVKGKKKSLVCKCKKPEKYISYAIKMFCGKCKKDIKEKITVDNFDSTIPLMRNKVFESFKIEFRKKGK